MRCYSIRKFAIIALFLSHICDVYARPSQPPKDDDPNESSTSIIYRDKNNRLMGNCIIKPKLYYYITINKNFSVYSYLIDQEHRSLLNSPNKIDHLNFDGKILPLEYDINLSSKCNWSLVNVYTSEFNTPILFSLYHYHKYIFFALNPNTQKWVNLKMEKLGKFEYTDENGLVCYKYDLDVYSRNEIDKFYDIIFKEALKLSKDLQNSGEYMQERAKNPTLQISVELYGLPESPMPPALPKKSKKIEYRALVFPEISEIFPNSEEFPSTTIDNDRRYINMKHYLPRNFSDRRIVPRESLDIVPYGSESLELQKVDDDKKQIVKVEGVDAQTQTSADGDQGASLGDVDYYDYYEHQDRIAKRAEEDYLLSLVMGYRHREDIDVFIPEDSDLSTDVDYYDYYEHQDKVANTPNEEAYAITWELEQQGEAYIDVDHCDHYEISERASSVPDGDDASVASETESHGDIDDYDYYEQYDKAVNTHDDDPYFSDFWDFSDTEYDAKEQLPASDTESQKSESEYEHFGPYRFKVTAVPEEELQTASGKEEAADELEPEVEPVAPRVSAPQKRPLFKIDEVSESETESDDDTITNISELQYSPKRQYPRNYNPFFFENIEEESESESESVVDIGESWDFSSTEDEDERRGEYSFGAYLAFRNRAAYPSKDDDKPIVRESHESLIKNKLHAVSQSLKNRLISQYDSSILRLGKNDNDFLADRQKELEKTLNGLDASILELQNAVGREKWIKILPNISKKLVEFKELTDKVYEKVHSSLPKEDALVFSCDSLIYKSECLVSLLGSFALLLNDIANNFNDNEFKNNKKEFETFKLNASALANKLQNSQKDESCNSVFKDVIGEADKAMDKVKSMINIVFARNGDKRDPPSDDLVKTVDSFIDKVTNVSMSAMPGLISLLFSGLLLFLV